MDNYLTRFESYPISNKWDLSMWASYLSALLKGCALEVFIRLSKDDQSDYSQIQEALLIISTLPNVLFGRSLWIVGPRKRKPLDN